MLKDHHWYAGGVGALFGAITIVVKLTSLDQSIHFWVQSDPPVGTP